MIFRNLRITLLLMSLMTVTVVNSQRLLTLQQALEQAMKTSPTMQASRLSLIKSEENLKAQRASLKSRFNLDVTPFKYSKTNTFDDNASRWALNEDMESSGRFSISQPILPTDATLVLSNNLRYSDNYKEGYFYNVEIQDFVPVNSSSQGFNNSLTLSLKQPLFTYNKTKQELQSLELAYENTSLDFALQELNVERSVTQAFYQVYQSQMSLNTSREEYENRKKSYEIIKNKVEGGLVAKEELYQAELDLLTSESSLKDAEVSFENDKDKFKQMLGISLEEEIMVLADISILPVDVDLKEAINYGISKRMEIRQREISINESQFSLIRTNASNEFKGDISIDVGIFGEDEKLPRVFDEATNNQDFSINLTIPIWDWGEKKARLKAAQASLESSKNSLRDEEINIKLTIRQVYRSLQNNLLQIEISRKNLENAQLTYEINLEKYKNGDLTSMDLNLVQNQLTTKKNQLTNSIISYKLELLNMKIQSMYDFENNVSVTPNFKKN